jgi:hypothetical protein
LKIKYWDRFEGDRTDKLSCIFPFCILLNAANSTVLVIGRIMIISTSSSQYVKRGATSSTCNFLCYLLQFKHMKPSSGLVSRPVTSRIRHMGVTHSALTMHNFHQAHTVTHSAPTKHNLHQAHTFTHSAPNKTPLTQLTVSPYQTLPNTPITQLTASPTQTLSSTSLTHLTTSPTSPLPSTPIRQLKLSPTQPLTSTPINQITASPTQALRSTSVT